MPSRPIIALLTDFGERDAYVGVMKGVILGSNPEVEIVDLCHDLDPQDVLGGAYLLRTAYPHFPDGTIFVAVVDPGVGTKRKAMAMQAGGWTFIGPDNGIFSYVLRNEHPRAAVELTNPDYRLDRASDTFHGRDVFAPAAAYVAAGVDLLDLGPAIDRHTYLADIDPRWQGDETYLGKVIHIDRFGNCITNIERTRAAESTTVRVGDISFTKVSRTYADVRLGEPLVLWGSSGHLEIAVNGGSAAKRLGIGRGNSVEVSSER